MINAPHLIVTNRLLPTPISLSLSLSLSLLLHIASRTNSVLNEKKNIKKTTTPWAVPDGVATLHFQHRLHVGTVGGPPVARRAGQKKPRRPPWPGYFSHPTEGGLIFFNNA